MQNTLLKAERSIPVQSRVDIVMLADMLLYFDEVGVRIDTMSKLMNMCIEFAHEVAEINGLLKNKHEGVGQAHNTMITRELYQPGMLRRSGRKLANAIAMENLRTEGVDPQGYVPGQYKTVHNSHSVTPVEGVDMNKVLDNYYKIDEEGKGEEVSTTPVDYTKDTSPIHMPKSREGKQAEMEREQAEKDKAKAETEEADPDD